MTGDLLEKLKQYGESDFYPLHMPGHKRQISHFADPFAIDITEIDGFDNLHHAQGILQEAQKRAARLYGAEETYYLVNGSTCGILTAVAAAVPRGGRILMARNCHKSVYNAVFLNDLRAEYLWPPVDPLRGIAGSISPLDVREVLRGQASDGDQGGPEQRSDALPGTGGQASDGDQGGPEQRSDALPGTGRQVAAGDRDSQGQASICAVLITSPTYDGVVSDIRVIAEEVHRAGAVLIVDEAHGAHFGMHPYFPKSALSCGADIVINSLHKTLPSLTQTALLHVQGSRVDREKLRKYLSIYQSSSPSYVLMAGMDACISLLERQGRELFETFVRRLEKMRSTLRGMQALHLVDGHEPELPAFGFDRSRVLISVEQARKTGTACAGADRGVNAVTGPELARLLRGNYHLEPEMAAADYVTAIMTVADTQEGFDRLTEALLEIDAGLSGAGVGGFGHVAENAVGESKKARHVSGEAGVKALETVHSDVEDSAEETKKAQYVSSEAGAKVPETVCPDTEAPAGEDRRSRFRNEEIMSIREAQERPEEQVPLKNSAGRVSAEYVYLYPPGIPLLVPGERISEELLQEFRRVRLAGLELQGPADKSVSSLRVVREDRY